MWPSSVSFFIIRIPKKSKNCLFSVLIDLFNCVFRCDTCVETLWARRSTALPCPNCGAQLFRDGFRLQLFADASVEKEINIRRRILKEYAFLLLNYYLHLKPYFNKSNSQLLFLSEFLNENLYVQTFRNALPKYFFKIYC